MKNKYSVFDWHSDVLYKIYNHPELDFVDSDALDINLKRLREGDVKVQAMAIFIEPTIPTDQQYEVALAQLRIYQKQVITAPGIRHLRSFHDIALLGEDEIGVFLTLEGLDCIGNDITKLIYLLDQGVLSVGMTWNSVNHACDGIGEPRGAGLSEFGFEVVALLNQRDVFVDVSHISLQGFIDVHRHSKHMIASHSNAQAICGHRRNLSDQQIAMMVERGALIHLVYCPDFVISDQEATITDLLVHIEHFISLGARDLVGMGSDFDGITRKVKDLTHAGETQNLLDALAKQHGETLARKISSQNFIDYIQRKM